MGPGPEFRFPPPRRWPWVALCASLATHGLLLFWRTEGRLPSFPAPPRRDIALIPFAPPDRYSFPGPTFALRETRRHSGRGAELVPKTPVLRPAVEPPQPPGPPVAESDTGAKTRRAPAGRIGPGLGNGRLWVQPLPLPPRELAGRLQRTNAELLDSVVTATIQSFLDSIALEPGAEHATLPDWTRNVAGLKFGLDSRNIYIAGLKIPAAVLALLPIPGANQSKAFDRSEEMYSDLRRAANRAATLAEFKQAIREMRERKEREREMLKAQRETPAPDSTRP